MVVPGERIVVVGIVGVPIRLELRTVSDVVKHHRLIPESLRGWFREGFRRCPDLVVRVVPVEECPDVTLRP